MSIEKQQIKLIIPQISITPPLATLTSSTSPITPATSSQPTSPASSSTSTTGLTSPSAIMSAPMNGLEAMFLHLTCITGDVFCLGMVHVASRRAKAREVKETGVDATERVIPGVRRSRVREE